MAPLYLVLTFISLQYSYSAENSNSLPTPDGINEGKLDERSEDEPGAAEEPDLTRFDVRYLGKCLSLRRRQRDE